MDLSLTNDDMGISSLPYFPLQSTDEMLVQFPDDIFMEDATLMDTHVDTLQSASVNPNDNILIDPAFSNDDMGISSLPYFPLQSTDEMLVQFPDDIFMEDATLMDTHVDTLQSANVNPNDNTLMGPSLNNDDMGISSLPNLPLQSTDEMLSQFADMYHNFMEDAPTLMDMHVDSLHLDAAQNWSSDAQISPPGPSNSSQPQRQFQHARAEVPLLGNSDVTVPDLDVNNLPAWTLNHSDPFASEFEDVDLRRRTCPHCQKVFSRMFNMKVHVASVHKFLKLFSCGLCDFTSALKGHLKHHVSEVHEKTKPFRCNTCENVFARRNQLMNHISKRHPDVAIYKCALCGSGFQTEEELQEHNQEKHIAGRPYVCEDCGLRYRRKGNLTEHQKETSHGTFGN